MTSTNTMDVIRVEKGWRIPYYIIISIFIFLLVNTITVLKVRGIVDREGYLWNSSRSVPILINTYEDDGIICVFGALGFFKDISSKFSTLINNGGPYVHIAKLLLWIGDKLGIIKRFGDPSAYYLYPQEYLRIWRFIGIYKVWLFLLWLPLVVYWIGTRHFSKTTGILASLLVMAIPFPTGFETRLKPDIVSIILGLFSMLYQLEYINSLKLKHLFLASVFLGFSLSVKFIMIPALFAFLIIYVTNTRKRWGMFFSFLGIIILVFVISNPLIISGLKIWLGSVIPYIKQGAEEGGSFEINRSILAIWYRILHFDSHFGKFLNWLVIPAMALAGIRLFLKKSYSCIASNIFFVSLLLYVIYYALVNQDRIIYITYYYYGAAIILVILIADFLSFIYRKTRLLGLGAIIFILCATGYENIKVFKYMTAKTNRQEMYSWIENNLPYGSVIGVPLEPNYAFFNQWVRMDPFKYRIVPFGKNAEFLDREKPDFAIWILYSKDSPYIENKNYTLFKEFACGTDLPHERYDLYQEEVFQIYKRNDLNPDISKRTILGHMESDMGELFRNDSGDEFRVLQFHSITFMPIWLNLMRWMNNTLEYDSHMSFEGAISVVRPFDFKYMYIHNVDPVVLQLWGVKYILSKLNPDSPFSEQCLNSGRYNFNLVKKYETFFNDEKREIGLFLNNEYIGQVFFVKYLNKDKSQLNQRAGILYDIKMDKGINNLAVYMHIEASVPLDVLIMGGGNRESWSIGVGKKTILMPYRIIDWNEPVRYEINLRDSDGELYIKEIYAMPFYLYGNPTVEDANITRNGGSAIVNSDSEGELIFSLPYHKYWRARVNGEQSSVMESLAGTIAVRVLPGRHFVEVFM